MNITPEATIYKHFLDFVTGLMFKWATGEDRPESGSLVKLVTQGGNTTLEMVQ